MANVPVREAGAGAGAVQHPRSSAALLLPAEFPRLHSALTFSRHEVDVLGGLHLFRPYYLEHDVPAPAPANNHGPPHDDVAAVPHIVANFVRPDAALD